MKWCNSNTIDKCLGTNKPFILNTDVSDGPGIHFITCFEYQPNQLFIIDSLGPKNYRENDNIMFNILDENNYDVKFYQYKFQQKLSNVCGFWAVWCCKIIEQLQDEYENVTPQLITKTLVKMVGKTANKKDVLQLINAFGLQK